MHPYLANHRIILASTSPRRRTLLEQICVKFEVIPSSFEENLPKHSFAEPADYVIATAMGKAAAVAAQHSDAVVIGADTVVILGSKILEKPLDAEDAQQMLTQLSGKTVNVVTAVCICSAGVRNSFYVTTEVEMAVLSHDRIARYVATGEPLDKAGSFATQGQGAVLVEQIRGCYNNVVGLPLTRLTQELEKMLSIE